MAFFRGFFSSAPAQPVQPALAAKAANQTDLKDQKDEGILIDRTWFDGAISQNQPGQISRIFNNAKINSSVCDDAASYLKWLVSREEENTANLMEMTPPFDAKGEVSPWLKSWLPDNEEQQRKIISYIQKLFNEAKRIVQDENGNIAPWLIKQLTPEKLKQAEELFSEEEVRIQLICGVMYCFSFVISEVNQQPMSIAQKVSMAMNNQIKEWVCFKAQLDELQQCSLKYPNHNPAITKFNAFVFMELVLHAQQRQKEFLFDPCCAPGSIVSFIQLANTIYKLELPDNTLLFEGAAHFLQQQYPLQEENIAATTAVKNLLAAFQKLRGSIENQKQNDAMQDLCGCALTVHKKGGKIANKLLSQSSVDIKRIEALTTSINRAQEVVQKPWDRDARNRLRAEAMRVPGKPSWGKKFCGFLTMLAGAALIVAGVLGLVLTKGFLGVTPLGHKLFTAGGSLVTAGGALLFYQGTRRSFSKPLSKLADAADAVVAAAEQDNQPKDPGSVPLLPLSKRS